MAVSTRRLTMFALLTVPLALSACDTKDGGDDDSIADGQDDPEDEPQDEPSGETDPGASGETDSEPGGGTNPGPEPDPEPSGQTDADPEPEPEPTGCENAGVSQACQQDDVSGVQFCDTIADTLQWGPCLEWIECTPGEDVDCGLCEPDEVDCPFEGAAASCWLVDGEPTMDEDACNTPLVLSFDGAPVQMQATPAATFDINDAGGCVSTDWPMATTPWLAIDLDRSGSIETGRELFGSGSRLTSGKRATNGFLALSELDDNGDGRINASDARFADLVLWGDEDADKLATFAELQPLAMRGILSIDLDYTIDRRCDDRGNCEVERASFTYLAHGDVRQGEVVDVHLSCQ